MSNRNSQSNKSAARERIRAERERQKKKDRLRRQLVVAGAVVGVLALAGGVGYAVMKANEPTGWEAAKEAELTKPAHTQGENGTEILIGDKGAKETLEVFEDIRCPACAAFEQSSGEALLKDVEDGRYKVRFTMYSFIDGMANGEGSKNALSALGAALDVSPEAFLKFKAALYSTKYHPDEREDVYAKDAELLKVAGDVPALKGNKAFETGGQEGHLRPLGDGHDGPVRPQGRQGHADLLPRRQEAGHGQDPAAADDAGAVQPARRWPTSRR